jgi:hypothetical protein
LKNLQYMPLASAAPASMASSASMAGHALHKMPLAYSAAALSGSFAPDAIDADAADANGI